MPSPLAEAHITAQERLRRLVQGAIASIWAALLDYDEASVAPFTGLAVPLVLAAQRQSVALTNAYLARALLRQPLALDIEALTGAAVRAGTPPEETYRRPFVTVWSALKAGTRWEDAVAQGLARAKSTAAMDVQLSMRQTLVAVGEQDEQILGYQRVPDAGACPFCVLVAGQRYLTDQLMPIHNNCGCGVDVITTENRGDFTGKAENDLNVTRDGVTAAVEEHGELGPVLVDGAHDFTAQADL